jgi:hypothetical protein
LGCRILKTGVAVTLDVPRKSAVVRGKEITGQYSLLYSAVRVQALSDNPLLHVDVAREKIFSLKCWLGADY